MELELFPMDYSETSGSSESPKKIRTRIILIPLTTQVVKAAFHQNEAKRITITAFVIILTGYLNAELNEQGILIVSKNRLTSPDLTLCEIKITPIFLICDLQLRRESYLSTGLL